MRPRDYDAEVVKILPHLRKLAQRFSSPLNEPDDFVQTAAMKLLASPKYHGANLSAIGYQMMRNAAIDAWRKNALLDGDEAFDTMASPQDPTSEDSVAAADVGRLIAGLPDHMRTALEMIVVTGLEYEEAAEILNVPLGTVKSRVNRAKARIIAGAGE